MHPPSSERGRATTRHGFTLLELLVIVSMIGLLLTIAAPNFRGLGYDLESAARETAGYFRLVRAQAITTTSAYRVVVASDTRLRAEFARTCTEPDELWEEDRRHSLQLREQTFLQGAEIQPEAVLLCFNTRGLADANPVLTVRKLGGDAFEVEVFLGGGVRLERLP